MRTWILPFLIACSGPLGQNNPNFVGESTLSGCPSPSDYRAEDVEIREEGWDIVALHESESGKRPELVVFFHGKNGFPKNNIRILGAAAYAGHRVIGLKHRTDPNTLDYCTKAFTIDLQACGEDLQAAKVYGAEVGSYIDFPDEHSIMARLHARLVELDDLYPGEGWAAYYQTMPSGTDHENYLNWEKIIVAGFSAGSGRAGLIGRNHPTAGVVLHSGIQDNLDWAYEGQTPAENHFTFAHVNEGYEEMTVHWDRIGIPGDNLEIVPQDVRLDLAEIDNLDTHRFISTISPVLRACPSDDPPHGSMAQTACMNTKEAVSGEPYALFRPYLYAYCSVAE